jgi:hypothetical protein
MSGFRFGIYGLNSLYLASQGRQATLFYDDQDKADLVKKIAGLYHLKINLKLYESSKSLEEIPDNSCDFVWAFNVLSDVSNIEKFLYEMARISRRYVFFTYMNKKNYGYFIHRLHHKKTRRRWDHTDLSYEDLKRADKILATKGFKLENKILLDVPWFPDIGAPIGEVARDLLGRSKPQSTSGESGGLKWDSLPYFDKNKYEKFKKGFAKDFIIEKYFPNFIKKFFAHHIGLLYQKGR